MSAPIKNSLVALIPTLRAFAVSLRGDPVRADDLVLETLVKAWAHRADFQAGTNLRAWLFTILRNTFLSDHRRCKREVEDRDGSLAAGLTVRPNQENAVDLNDVRVALARLAYGQREALLLIGAAGFSYDEAAKICSCSVGTVKSRVNRARVSLAAMLEVTGADEVGPAVASSSSLARSARQYE